MIDASKKVTLEGLELLGWDVLESSATFRLSDEVFDYMVYYPAGLFGDISDGEWYVADTYLRGKLAPRTLAEVKWLMGRMIEDA